VIICCTSCFRKELEKQKRKWKGDDRLSCMLYSVENIFSIDDSFQYLRLCKYGGYLVAEKKDVESKVNYVLWVALKEKRWVHIFPSLLLLFDMGKLNMEWLGRFKVLVRDFCQAGLKDAIREFPRRDASRFRSEVSLLANKILIFQLNYLSLNFISPNHSCSWASWRLIRSDY